MTRSRRRFLHLGGVTLLAGLAGCGGNGGDGTDDATETATPTSTVEQVPEQYRTATAQGGGQRDPEALSSPSAVSYQSEPNEGQQCSTCQFYIEDINGDGMGACSIVEGVINPEGWCTSYALYPPATAETDTATETDETPTTT